MCNLIYMHLRPPHSAECGGECVPGCRWVWFDNWLDEPLLPFELREQARRQARIAAFLRGEISA